MPTKPSPAGRPRDAHLDAAILDAVSAALDSSGYGGVAIEQVARAAGVSKTAIYRRWPNRQLLVLAELRRRMATLEPPLSGCTLCDLHEALSLFVDTFTRVGPRTLAPLLADCAEPALREQLMESLFEPPRAAVGATLEAARDRGDLRGDIDLTLTIDSLASLVFYRLLFGHAPLTGPEIGHVVTVLLSGIARDFDALLREYRDHGEPESPHPAP